MPSTEYRTRGGVLIGREVRERAYRPAETALGEALDERRGVLFSSSFEFPGRYTRWDMGFVDPPLAFTARRRGFAVEALNPRGEVLIPAVAAALSRVADAQILESAPDRIRGAVAAASERFPEEARSRQPSVFTVLRALIDLFASPEDPHLGLYGAFGYDLVFQFEPMPLKLFLDSREAHRTLYFADESGGEAAAGAFKPGAAAILTGPEGGFTDEERASIRAAPGAVAISLGPRILRAETAALAALSAYMAVAGDWRP